MPVCLSLFGCRAPSGQGQTASAPSSDETASAVQSSFAELPPASGGVDIDLSKMGATMAFSVLYDIKQYPDKYLGKRVRVSGTFAVAEGEGINYYACRISDANACCVQGIEFVPASGVSFPEDFPARGEQITVVGTFDLHEDGDNKFYELTDTVVE